MALTKPNLPRPLVVADATPPPTPAATRSGRKWRIAAKCKGKIVFLDLREVVAVEAERNSVRLSCPTSSILLRDSIAALAAKLEPYGFVRIHRSVIVNGALVEEIRPWPTGQYGLRMKGGKEFTVTRTYKENLRSIADLWIGTDAENGPGQGGRR